MENIFRVFFEITTRYLQLNEKKIGKVKSFNFVAIWVVLGNFPWDFL